METAGTTQEQDVTERVTESPEETETTQVTDALQNTGNTEESGDGTQNTDTPETTNPPEESKSPTTEPTQGTTEPSGPVTEPSVPVTEPTTPDTETTPSNTESSDSGQCAHTWTDWSYEEYTYKQQGIEPDTQWYDRPSHRLARSCTKCGQKETGNTPDHYCARGADNHTVTTVKAGTCAVGATMRSTCKICGWYTEYEGKKEKHEWFDETIHISDYTEYTNELDATISTCNGCGLQSISYHKGQGFASLSVAPDYGFAMKPEDKFEYAVYVDDFRLLEHPEWQTVYRNIVYNAEGYVIQFDYIYCTSDGTRYVCTAVDTSDVAGVYEELGNAPPLEEYEGMNYHLTYYFGVAGEYVYPSGWRIGWSG